MIDKRILSIRKSIANWENRILAIAGVDPCKCPNCKNKMRFHDIVYPKYGSMRERLRIKIISENEDKLEEIKKNLSKLGIKDSSTRIYNTLKELIMNDRKFY